MLFIYHGTPKVQNIRTEQLSISPTSNMETEVTYAVALKKKKKGKMIVEASKKITALSKY